MILTASISGLKVFPVIVESSLDRRSVIRGIDIVGMADTAVKESEKRVKNALSSFGFDFMRGRITVNLSPADIKKKGSHFDLAVALSILEATGDLKDKEIFAMGELSLSGELRKVRGVLPALLNLRDRNFDGVVIVPKENEREAAVVGLTKVYALSTLREAVELVNDLSVFEEVDPLIPEPDEDHSVDMSEVRGQEVAKRALEIAAAGAHNVLMVGPPGSGKTMLARRFPTVLPSMTVEEMLQTSQIYSVAGLLESGVITKRPFRSPHHTSSVAAIVGGGASARPGEISLAHNGVLFMDELPEFRRDVLEALREPLEEGVITVARASVVATYPARFVFIGAMNPCPCTEVDDNGECICTELERIRYARKISGPILDRIDLHLRVRRMKFEEYRKGERGESSASIRERVIKARRRQLERGKLNSQLTHSELERYIKLDAETEGILERFSDKFRLSARAIDKILRVARTIADLAGSDRVKKEHVLEAMQYRAVVL